MEVAGFDIGLGGTMVLACLQQWSYYLQGPGFETTYDQWSFFACNKVSLLNNQIPTLRPVEFFSPVTRFPYSTIKSQL